MVCFVTIMYSKENNTEMRDNQNFTEVLEEKLLNPDTDLRRLSAEQQFDLITSKAALHPEAIIPKPTSDRNDVLHLLQHSKRTRKPPQKLNGAVKTSYSEESLNAPVAKEE